MSSVSYTKLKDGNWGLRATGPLTEGQIVTVTKRSGETKDEIVSRKIWDNGSVYLYALAPRRAKTRANMYWDSCDYCGTRRLTNGGDTMCARCGEVS